VNKNKRATYLQTISELQRRYLRAQWALKYVVFSLTCTKKESGRLLLVDASPDLLEVKPTVKLVGRRCARSLAHLLIRVALTRCKVSVTRMGHQHTPCRVFFDGRCTISRWLEHLKGAAEVTRAHLTSLSTCCWGEFVQTGTPPLVHLWNDNPFQTTQCKLWQAYEAFVNVNKHIKPCCTSHSSNNVGAFGLLGNKGMHAYNGNLSSSSSETDSEFDEYMALLIKNEAAKSSSYCVFTPPLNADKYWVEVVRGIVAPSDLDIEELLAKNTQLCQAIAWSVTNTTNKNIPSVDEIITITLARLDKIAGNPNQYPYNNWERAAYHVADTVTSMLYKKNWRKNISQNPFLDKVPMGELKETPSVNTKNLLFKAARLSSRKKFTVKKCLQQNKCKHITEINYCLELISLKPFNHYKWWANGLTSGLKRQLPYMGNHKALQHVPLRVTNSEEYKVPTCIVQSSKILKVQQAILVALILKWNSCSYRTWNPSIIEGNYNVCGGDNYCCPSPHCCKAQMIPLTNRDGQVSCLDRLGSIPCPIQSSANWSAC